MEKCFILYNFGKIIIAYWNLKDIKVHIKWLIWIIGDFNSFYNTVISQGNCPIYAWILSVVGNVPLSSLNRVQFRALKAVSYNSQNLIL